ncbi:type IV conjugative transfer system lipoprotein TraV [Acidithiobacillus ferrooxidans]|uniref:type IV conjugative transfer system lipoprotein TraV n=1 Tax=Acidithiobacillus ferrooxidans TaxID=920 RepID=UPI001C06F6C5|nr:type IV conjugative transfer system lipoprotein TraV [Acidithiobacillus ferrooxidans]MBU2774236.1 type IV conjugative transfer system lipoprotein TraV [Acidithiobacillus ferrooxidans]
MKIRFALASAIIALGGCATSHPCIHGKGGVCVGPRETWGITRHRDQVNPDKRTLKAQNEARKLLHTSPSQRDQLPNIHPQTAASQQALDGAKTAQYTTGNQPLQAPTGYPKPLLTQPRVLRVWVAPYRGPEGNLHFPGMVYSIIQPQSWTLGHGSSHVPIPVADY